jgi:hypothetical protein
LKRGLGGVVFWTLVVVNVGLAVFAVLVFEGRFVQDESRTPTGTTSALRAGEPARAPVPQPPASTQNSERPQREAPSPAPGAQPSTFTIAATRGDSWLQARAGSATGRVLHEGILLQGERINLRARQLWIRFGVSANVDLAVDGRRRVLPPGTVDVVVSPLGVPAGSTRTT